MKQEFNFILHVTLFNNVSSTQIYTLQGVYQITEEVGA